MLAILFESPSTWHLVKDRPRADVVSSSLVQVSNHRFVIAIKVMMKKNKIKTKQNYSNKPNQNKKERKILRKKKKG